MVKASANLEPGFKMTELGVLSEEWEVIKLSDALILRKESVDPKKFPDLRYVGLEHIDSGDCSLRRWGNTTEVRSSKHHFYEGDILYGKLRPYLDKTVETRWEGLCSTDILVFEPSKKSIQDFIINLLHTSGLLKHAISTTTGVNHPRTSWKALSQYSFPLPTLPEQRAIAHVLKAVQRSREATKVVIDAAKKLKRSLMRHLFTYGVVRVGAIDQVKLKDTEIGPVPEEWGAVKLGSVFKLTSGKSSPTSVKGLLQGDHPFPVYGGNGILGFSSEYFLEKSTIVLGRVGAYCGAIHVSKPKSWISDNALYVKQMLREDVDLYFLAYLLHYMNLNKYKNRGGQPLISQSIVYSREIGLPPLPEQCKIASILSALDRKIETEQARKAALDNLFKTLLANLMTGKIRVKKHILKEMKDDKKGKTRRSSPRYDGS